MNHIPKSLNDEINEDPFYKKCCLSLLGGCEGRIERHHALIFGGKQVQKKYCILPACSIGHHDKARRSDIKERFDWVWLNRASVEELKEISKAENYILKRDRLNQKYGIYKTC